MAKPHILVSEHLGDRALAVLREGADLEAYDLLSEEKFRDRLQEADAVIIRSAHSLRAQHLALAPKLRVAARAGAGVDNIDIDTATARGIVVINTPGANAVAAAEHTLGLLLAVMRKIPEANRHVREGGWDRQAFIGHELRGRRLGIIGIGRVGTQVALRARAFGMEIRAYDPYVAPAVIAERGAIAVDSLEDLLASSEVLTIHTPKTGPRLKLAELQRLPQGAVVLNVARGGLVDEDALARLLDSGHVSGAALDVFSKEPPQLDHPIFQHPNVVVTCHLGGSTVEAQVAIGERVAFAVLDALEGRVPSGVVNLPAQGYREEATGRLIELGQAAGRLLALSGSSGRTLRVAGSGGITGPGLEMAARAVLWGFLDAVGEEAVNLVSAVTYAGQRGITVLTEQPLDGDDDHETGLAAWFDEGRASAVEVTRRDGIRLRRFWGARFDMGLSPYMLVTRHHDQPGIVGAIGSVLGKAHVNIATLELGRDAPGGQAVMLLGLDNPVDVQLAQEIQQLEAISMVRSLAVGGQMAHAL